MHDPREDVKVARQLRDIALHLPDGVERRRLLAMADRLDPTSRRPRRFG